MEQKSTMQSEFKNKYEAVNPLIVFPIVALSLLMITVDSTIVATALHALQIDLQTSVSWAGWTLTAYSFGFVVMLPALQGCKKSYICTIIIKEKHISTT
ncbi:MAG TPA: MFS transporter [Bacteroidales bacterium]|nr:MFS transporter [Bacteroidales bacterium]